MLTHLIRTASHENDRKYNRKQFSYVKTGNMMCIHFLQNTNSDIVLEKASSFPSRAIELMA